MRSAEHSDLMHRLLEGRIGRREFIQRALAAGVSVAAVGAALGASPRRASAQDPTPVTFIGPENPEAFDPVLAGFHAEHPDVRVTYNNYPFDQLETILTSRFSTQDASFDVYTIDQSRVAARAARGHLVDITDQVGDFKGKVLEAQYVTSLYQDRVYCLPVWTSLQTLYYNADLLETAGVQPPSIDPQQRWTWEQTVEAAKQAQGAGAQYGLIFEQVNRYYQLQPLPESAGGGPGVTGEDLLTVDLTNEGWQKAMTWYASLFEEGVSPRGIEVSQNLQLFIDGKVAFYVGLSANQFLDQQKAEGLINWGVAPHPYFEGGTVAVPTDSWSWGLNPFSENQEAALRFMEYASLNPKGALESIEQVPLPPANAEAFEQYLQGVGERPTEPEGVVELIRYEFENSVVHRPQSVAYVEFEQYLNTRTFPDIANGADVQGTLEESQSELERQLEPIREQLGGS